MFLSFSVIFNKQGTAAYMFKGSPQQLTIIIATTHDTGSEIQIFEH